ncbi:MAG: hypothetical protein DMF71_18650 [Acidobacteria bacterium]|nr:MAG: hypothetical protein DMF71_18650 [Acidobacteriota bacterium]
MIDDDYQRVAQTYKNLPEGSEKKDALNKATGLLDKAIDDYAHAVALSEGRPEYQRLHDQLLSDLSVHYKIRHSNSTDGLQQLIDKYKPAAKP